MNESLVFSELNGEFIYNRINSLECIELANKLTGKYGINNLENTTILPSGMSAISTALHATYSLCMGNINLIYSNEMFALTPNLIKYIKKYLKFNCYKIDVTDKDILLNLFTKTVYKQTNILFLESCSNPNGLVFDFSLISELRQKSEELYTIIDNTWLTSEIFNPFIHNVDIVVLSLTKYYSGGICMAGAVLTQNEKIHKKISAHTKLNGLHVSPYNCKCILNNIDDMPERIKKTSSMTCKLIDYLKKQENVHNVTHVSCINHESHNLAKKYFKTNNNETLYPSVFTFYVKLDIEVFKKWIISSNIEYKTSFGGPYTRIDDHPKITDNGIRCRISIGYEDSLDGIIEKINELLNSYPNENL